MAVACIGSALAQNSIMNLNGSWQFRRAGATAWHEATVPGTVHTDLLRIDQIPEPYYRLNERHSQWVDKCDWEYRHTFNVAEADATAPSLMLRFNGLDTYAEVTLNGEKILEADNMFRRWDVDVTHKVLAGDNELLIHFFSPIARGLQELESYGYKLPATNDQAVNGGLESGEALSVFMRKAPYHFGWDWGPRFVTSGVFRPIELIVQKSARIEDVYYRQDDISAKRAEITVIATIKALEDQSMELVIKDRESGSSYLKSSVNLRKGENIVELPMAIAKPRLWWTNGLGKAELYQLEASLVESAVAIDTKEETIGIRSLEFVAERDDIGVSCYFKLNGEPLFIKGANHIPNDLFVDRMTEEVYDKEIADAKDANMNMLRVWGGGIYESDYFYKRCNEEGILIWQDFMFACSMYPNIDSFYKSIEQEAIDNVKRLRNNACIALWCGNNEIEGAWNHYYERRGWGWKEKMTHEQREECWYAYNRIFKEVLPAVVERYDNRSYRHSSPMTSQENVVAGDGTLTDGDIHYWGVWHSKKPFEEYHNVLGRFMSEYGFQSFPELRTIAQYAERGDYDIESEVMRSHQRSPIGNSTIAEYLDLYYNKPDNFEDFIYLQQVLQAEGIGMAIEAHRHNMPHTMGTLYWQINDCWPVASWSSTDYYRRWKALHYFVRRTFEAQMLTSKVVDGRLQVSFVNDYRSGIKGVELTATVMNPRGEVASQRKWQANIEANGVTRVMSEEMSEIFSDKEQFIVVRAVSDGEQIGESIFYPSKIKEMELPMVEPTIEVSVVDGVGEVTISSPVLLKNLWVDFPRQEGFFSDNYFDLLPGERVTITFTPASGLFDASEAIAYKTVNSLSYE